MRYSRRFLGTVCVPWHDDDTVDVPTFRASIRTLVTAGMRDLYIFGTAGEGHAVTDEQFRQVTNVFVDEYLASGGVDPMVGVIGTSLATSLDRVRFAHDLGVRDFQFSLPPWAALTERETATVFAAYCDGFADSRFMHYNLLRAGRLVAPQEYAALAARHDNLVATKYGAGEPGQVAGLLAEAPEVRHFFTENGYAVGAPLGECGFIASVASSNPVRAQRYADAGAEANANELALLHAELSGLNAALAATLGPGRIDGTYDKAIHRLVNPDFPLRLLPPFEGASVAEFEAYRSIVSDRYPQWLPERGTADPAG